MAAGTGGTHGQYFEGFGSVMQIFGAQQSASAEIATNNLNNDILRKNIMQVRRQAMDEERRVRNESSKAIGQMRANYGASGVTLEGSALSVLEESARNAELDALNVRYAGEDQMRQIELEMKANDQRSQNAQRQANIKSVSAMINFGGSMMSGMG